MTRMEYIQSCSKDELVKVLCDIVCDVNEPKPRAYICADCPAKKYCYSNHAGFAYWLEQEWGTDEEDDE